MPHRHKYANVSGQSFDNAETLLHINEHCSLINNHVAKSRVQIQYYEPTVFGVQPNCTGVQRKGVFEFDIEPYKSKLVLDSGLVLKIKEAWVENTWNKQVLMIGKTMISKGDDHQVVLNLDILENASQRTNKFYYFWGLKH